MSAFAAAWSAEVRKVRRSRLPLVTVGVVAVTAAVEGVLMVIAADPERARALGLLGQKAQFAGVEFTWDGLLGFMAQVSAVASLMLFAFVLTWVFGREFTDRAAHYLMALPVGRATVVAAKFAVATCWCVGLAALLVGFGLGVGAVLGLPGWDSSVAASGVERSLLAAVLMVPAVLPVAFVASAARGYLAPLAVALGMLVAAQLGAALGWAAAVPWAAPALAAGLVPGAALTPGAVAVTLATGVAGAAGTVAWWRSGDAGR
jgi:ABC-2 type transport system permease protein